MVRNQERHHAAAAAKGIRLVHCCGYDSIPFDLGVYSLIRHIQKNMPGREVTKVSRWWWGPGGWMGSVMGCAMYGVLVQRCVGGTSAVL